MPPPQLVAMVGTNIAGLLHPLSPPPPVATALVKSDIKAIKYYKVTLSLADAPFI